LGTLALLALSRLLTGLLTRLLAVLAGLLAVLTLLLAWLIFDFPEHATRQPGVFCALISAAITAFAVADYQVERIAANVHQEHMMSDLWDDGVVSWLNAPAEINGFEIEDAGKNGEQPFRSADLLRAIGVQISKSGRSEQIRLSRILQRYGYESKPQWVEGKTANVWLKK